MNNQLFKETNLMLFFCFVWIVSLVFSPFLLTISMIGFFVMGIVALVKKVRSKETSFSQFLVNFSKDPISILVIFFIITLLSWLYSTDMHFWLERLRLRMLFLFLPFSFFALPKFSNKQVVGILYFLISILVVSNIWIGIQYYMNFEAYQHLISVGKSIPTPRNHIRYNLILAISIVAGVYLWINDEMLKFKWERKVVFIITLFSFIFIHVLAVRSGLVSLYIALIVLLFKYVIQHKKYLWGAIGMALFILMASVSVKMIPSLKNKLDYTKWDYISTQDGGNIKEHSDGERMKSQIIGLEIFYEQPLIGVGSGDLKNIIKQKYKEKFGADIAPKMPHNQYISILAKNGILGFFAFMVATLLPLYYKKNYNNFFILGFYIILLTSYLVENTIENAIGAGIFALFVILGLRWEKDKVNNY